MASDGKVIISTKLDNSGIAKGANQLKGQLGNIASAARNVGAVIVATFGAAAVAITKQAVDAYADYEQLIGGVETLFKDSADKVKAYAEDAFYAVGISANEYMETVTSFSASLISSLAGDTAKAADVADMALTDMADNSNKMGTALESIKTAYQGFAKQNYTMLDNLKLGYGGTKTEMERLLADAEKLTGIKYNIKNLADVYNAIHAIQVEMGIAGTTAKEAEKTITGSANMTKAAWKNVLAAIAGGGDIDKAINNLVYSISKYFDNIVPVVERSLAGIGELIEQAAPMLVQTVAAALIRAIPSLLNAVYRMIIGLANGIYQGIVALFSGSTKEIASQLNGADDLTDSYNNAAEGARNLASAIIEAANAARKSLAPFDEITKIGKEEENFSVTADPTPGAATGDANQPGKDLSQLGESFNVFGEAAKSLQKISFDKVSASLKKLLNALKPYKKLAVDGLWFLWDKILVPLAEWTVEDALPVFLGMLSEAIEALTPIIEAIQPTLDWLWEDIIKPMADFVGQAFIDFMIFLTDAFRRFSDWAANNKETVREIFDLVIVSLGAIWVFNTTKKIVDFLCGLGIAFSNLGNLMGTAGFKIAFVAAAIGILAAGIIEISKHWDKMTPGDKAVAILTALAAAATAAAIAIGVFQISWSVGVAAAAIAAGLTLLGLSFAFPDTGDTGDAALNAANSFYSSYDWNKSFTLPALANGAVLPPNKPFLAMVGDQKHGTNIEAPLATIQEAVALVMEDMTGGMMAGFEATVAVLKEILEAVYGIEVGDDVIGRAVARYNTKMAIARGGV